jgi:hypothetical protein
MILLLLVLALISLQVFMASKSAAVIEAKKPSLNYKQCFDAFFTQGRILARISIITVFILSHIAANILLDGDALEYARFASFLGALMAVAAIHLHYESKILGD